MKIIKTHPVVTVNKKIYLFLWKNRQESKQIFYHNISSMNKNVVLTANIYQV